MRNYVAVFDMDKQRVGFSSSQNLATTDDLQQGLNTATVVTYVGTCLIGLAILFVFVVMCRNRRVESDDHFRLADSFGVQ
jgi:hypothetical protein